MRRVSSQEGTREINRPTSSAFPPGGWKAKGAHQFKFLWLSLLGQGTGRERWRVDLEGQMKKIQHWSEIAKELEGPLCIFTSTGENSKVICFPTILFLLPYNMFIRNIIIQYYALVSGEGNRILCPMPRLKSHTRRDRKLWSLSKHSQWRTFSF